MRNSGKVLVSAAAAASLAIAGQSALAQSFNSGLPAGWTVNGTAGTSDGNGVVTLVPIAGSTAYGWVSTEGSNAKTDYGIGGETNGSTLRSVAFAAATGDDLKFSFNYVTSDGSSYANLLNVDGTIAAALQCAHATEWHDRAGLRSADAGGPTGSRQHSHHPGWPRVGGRSVTALGPVLGQS